MTRLMLRLLVAGGLLCGLAPLAAGQGITYYPPPATSSGGDVVGPASATDNAVCRWDGATGKLTQNSLAVLSDLGALSGLTGLSSTSVTDSGLTSGRVVLASTGGLLADDADLTFATDTLTATKVSVKAGSGSGALSVGGVLCKGAPAQATTGTSEQALATCAIPANTLTAAGSMLRIAWNGQTAANGNNKTVYVRIGASGTCPGTCTLIYQSATSGLNNQDAYSFATEAAYKSSTTAVVKGVAQTLSDAGATTASTYGAYMNRNASVAWTSALEVTISALTPTSAGDFTLLSYSVEVVQ